MTENIPYPKNLRCQRPECNNEHLVQIPIVTTVEPSPDWDFEYFCPNCNDLWQECKNHDWHYLGKREMPQNR